MTKTCPYCDATHDYAAILRRQAEVMDDPEELLYAAHHIEKLEAEAALAAAPALRAQPASPLQGRLNRECLENLNATDDGDPEGNLFNVLKRGFAAMKWAQPSLAADVLIDALLSSAPPEQPSGPITTEQLDNLQFGRSLHNRPKQLAIAPLEEGIEILDNLLAFIRKHGNYSPESTIMFIDQSLQCFRAAIAAAPVMELEAILNECELAARGPVYREIYNGVEGDCWDRFSSYGRGRHDAADAIHNLIAPDKETTIPDVAVRMSILNDGPAGLTGKVDPSRSGPLTRSTKR